METYSSVSAAASANARSSTCRVAVGERRLLVPAVDLRQPVEQLLDAIAQRPRGDCPTRCSSGIHHALRVGRAARTAGAPVRSSAWLRARGLLLRGLQRLPATSGSTCSDPWCRLVLIAPMSCGSSSSPGPSSIGDRSPARGRAGHAQPDAAGRVTAARSRTRGALAAAALQLLAHPVALRARARRPAAPTRRRMRSSSSSISTIIATPARLMPISCVSRWIIRSRAMSRVGVPAACCRACGSGCSEALALVDPQGLRVHAGELGRDADHVDGAVVASGAPARRHRLAITLISSRLHAQPPPRRLASGVAQLLQQAPSPPRSASTARRRSTVTSRSPCAALRLRRALAADPERLARSASRPGP